MNMENKVPQAQTVMTDEEMAGVELQSYSTSKYLAQSNKRKQKSSKRETTKKKKEESTPLQDFDTKDLLREFGFEVIDEGQQEDVPTIQTSGAVKEEPMECFFHDCKLEKCTSQTGWEYVRCPTSDFCIFKGLDKVNSYLKNVQSQIPVWFKRDKEKLKCFCSEPLVLCQSRSEKNPDRMYFKCQRNRCKFFLWVNEEPMGRVKAWIQGEEHRGRDWKPRSFEVTHCHPSPDANGYPRQGFDEVPARPPPVPVPIDRELWNQCQNEKICVIDSTNQIVSPDELAGHVYSQANEKELLEKLYFLRMITKRQSTAISDKQTLMHLKNL